MVEVSVQTLRMDLLDKEMRIEELEDQLKQAQEAFAASPSPSSFSSSSSSSIDKETIEKLREEIRVKDKKVKESEETAKKFVEEKELLDSKILKITAKVQEWNEKKRQDIEVNERLRIQFDEEKKALLGEIAALKASAGQTSAVSSFPIPDPASYLILLLPPSAAPPPSPPRCDRLKM